MACEVSGKLEPPNSAMRTSSRSCAPASSSRLPAASTSQAMACPSTSARRSTSPKQPRPTISRITSAAVHHAGCSVANEVPASSTTAASVAAVARSSQAGGRPSTSTTKRAISARWQA
jgi:hypothetical protein